MKQRNNGYSCNHTRSSSSPHSGSQRIQQNSSKGEPSQRTLGQRSGRHGRSISSNHGTISSYPRTTSSQTRPIVPLDVFRTQIDFGTVAWRRLMVIRDPGEELRLVVPPSTSNPATETITPAGVVGGGGPLQACSINVVATLFCGKATTVDTNWLPGRVEVDVCNNCTPWKVVSEVEFQWVGCRGLQNRTEGCGFIQKGIDAVGAVRNKSCITHTYDSQLAFENSDRRHS